MVTAILRRNVSEKRAFELVARGAEVGADEAERIGLINRVFDDGAFETEVESYVQSFERASRSAVALTKRLLYQMDGMNFDDALEAGVDVNTIARMTDDCREGVARFLGKGGGRG
jgi:methylglutaconyl-CoA hydratase